MFEHLDIYVRAKGLPPSGQVYALVSSALDKAG